MKKILITLLLFASFSLSAQVMPNFWSPTSGTDTYTVYIPNFGTISNKIAFVRFTNTNTGSSTININSTGATTLKKWDGDSWENLEAGDLDVDTDYRLSYDNTNTYFRVEGVNLVSGGGGGIGIDQVMDSIGNAVDTLLVDPGGASNGDYLGYAGGSPVWSVPDWWKLSGTSNLDGNVVIDGSSNSYGIGFTDLSTTGFYTTSYRGDTDDIGNYKVSATGENFEMGAANDIYVGRMSFRNGFNTRLNNVNYYKGWNGSTYNYLIYGAGSTQDDSERFNPEFRIYSVQSNSATSTVLNGLAEITDVVFKVNRAGDVRTDGSISTLSTSNQLILGTTRTVTINAPTPATTSRVWTIPDNSANQTFASEEYVLDAIDTLVSVTQMMDSITNAILAIDTVDQLTVSNTAGIELLTLNNSAAPLRKQFDMLFMDATGVAGSWTTLTLGGYSNATVTIKFTVTAVKSDGTESYGAGRTATFNKDGATLTQVGTTTIDYEHETDTGADPQFSVGVNANLVEVTFDSGDADSYRWTIWANVTITEI